MKIAAALLVLSLATPAGATTTYRVDDSLTLPHESNQAMKWRSLAPNRTVGNAVEGTSVITIRLDTAPWMNRMGKIYMALPEQPIGQVTAEWTTQGRLLPGQLISGNRTLVYAGPIKSGTLEDTIALKISADGRRLVSAQRLQFYFEIDVD
ncbi:MAG TPA: hypothetical protein VGI57_10840 [Usitatibacter sp.]